MRARGLWFVLLFSGIAVAADLVAVPLGSKVRIRASSIDGDWRTGTLKKGGECTMVYLDRAAPGGYTALALNALDTLEVAAGTAWAAVNLQALLMKETKACREAANG